jgi:pyruvate-formate lyase-activating enzyme
MKAATARAASERAAEAPRIKREKESEERRFRDKKAKSKKHKDFYASLLRHIYASIDYTVKDGKKSISRTLVSEHWVSDKSVYGDFFKRFEFAKEVKLVLRKLHKDGYKAVIEGRCVEHDTSAAYMNSGGECGSETPYHTYDSILVVSWE